MATSQIRNVCRRRRRRSRCRRARPHTPHTQSVWPVEGAAGPAGGDIPDPQRLVVGGGDDPGAVGRHRTPPHPVGVARQGAAGLAGGDVPDPQRLVAGGGDDPGAVGGHRTPPHRIGVACQGATVSPVATSQIRNVSSRRRTRSRCRRGPPHTPTPPRCGRRWTAYWPGRDSAGRATLDSGALAGDASEQARWRAPSGRWGGSSAEASDQTVHVGMEVRVVANLDPVAERQLGKRLGQLPATGGIVAPATSTGSPGSPGAAPLPPPTARSRLADPTGADPTHRVTSSQRAADDHQHTSQAATIRSMCVRKSTPSGMASTSKKTLLGVERLRQAIADPPCDPDRIVAAIRDEHPQPARPLPGHRRSVRPLPVLVPGGPRSPARVAHGQLPESLTSPRSAAVVGGG